MNGQTFKTVKVYAIPRCDFCLSLAAYDAKTTMGPWGNLCEKHFRLYGRGLGLGLGQRLVKG